MEVPTEDGTVVFESEPEGPRPTEEEWPVHLRCAFLDRNWLVEGAACFYSYFG